VRKLYHRLIADGFDPWLDEEELIAGQRWEKEIPRAVRRSDVVIVCLSRNSITKAGYIQKEIKFALDVADEQPEGTIFLIPLKLEDCNIPESLSWAQWINYFDDRGYERLRKALMHRADAMGLNTERIPAVVSEGFHTPQNLAGNASRSLDAPHDKSQKDQESPQALPTIVGPARNAEIQELAVTATSTKSLSDSLSGQETLVRRHPTLNLNQLRWIIGIGALLIISAIVIVITTRKTTISTANSRQSIAGSTQQLGDTGQRIVVGSKDFTESNIVSEILSQMLETQGLQVERLFDLGGNLTHDALISGKIDIYPEYTSTSYFSILKPDTNDGSIYVQVKREYAQKFNVELSEPLGFANDYAILVRGQDARRLSLKTISDATKYTSNWRIAAYQDFISREDGYAGFADAYKLKFAEPPRAMDLSSLYRALANGTVDMIVGNSTDGLIPALDLVQLRDDRRYFPNYDAVFLIKKDTLAHFPSVQNAFARLRYIISNDEMRYLNYEVDGKKRAVADVVSEWRQRKGL
jgi:glycine betaine/choline ABC-type transport system substrate-binding protein